MNFKALFTIAIFTLLLACNDEAGIAPSNYDTLFKLIPGEGRDDIPESINLLPNGDYLIVANTSLSVDTETITKIRVLRLSNRGELIFDKYFPSENDLSWTANRTHILDGEIIIAGNSLSQNMLLLKLSTEGDSLISQVNFENTPLFQDSKLVDGELLVMSSLPGAVVIQSFSVANLIANGSFSKTFSVDQSTVLAPSLMVKGDTLAFATNTTINYALRQSNEGLEVDDRLSTKSNLGQFKIEHLVNTSSTNTAIGFGELKVGEEASNWFVALSDVKNNLGEPDITLFESNLNNNDILHNIHIEEDHLLLCGSRASFGSNNSNFLLMKTDLKGDIKFSRSFGSSNSQNALYDAIWDNGQIVAVGTVLFSEKQTIVVSKLTADGQLIR